MFNVFVDTNIFLGLYESNENTVEKIFKDLSNIKHSIVFVDQVYDEFVRNRDTSLEKQIKQSSSNSLPQIHTTALIKSLNEYSELVEAEKVFKEKHKCLIQKLREIKDSLERDIVYKKFCEFYKDTSIKIYHRTDDIIDKAYKRKLIGNPPVSKGQDTIGDQVIWETLLSNLDNDLIFITRDNTYKDHRTFLQNEFNQRTKKELSIHENLSFALTKIGATPSKELLEVEKEIQRNEEKDLIYEDKKYPCYRCNNMVSIEDSFCPHCHVYLDY